MDNFNQEQSYLKIFAFNRTRSTVFIRLILAGLLVTLLALVEGCSETLSVVPLTTN